MNVADQVRTLRAAGVVLRVGVDVVSTAAYVLHLLNRPKGEEGDDPLLLPSEGAKTEVADSGAARGDLALLPGVSVSLAVAGSLSLACKLCESPRRTPDVVSAVWFVEADAGVDDGGNQGGADGGNINAEGTGAAIQWYPSEDELPALSAAVGEAEELILRAIGYALEIPLPFKWVCVYGLALEVEADAVKAGLALAADAFLGPLCTEYPPTVLAAAALYLGLCLSQTDLGERHRGCEWWTGLDVPTETLASATGALLDVYEAAGN